MSVFGSPSHVVELDGLRAIAILSVMVFHLGLFPIGWMGVPLFFVLSGYLITRILVATRGAKLGEYLGRFYWRRTIRIFPLYYVYLAVNAGLAVALGLSLSGYGWFVAYLGNHQIGNLAPNVPGGVIGHLWTLAVEEQFYLIWPLVIFFSRRVWPLAVAAMVIAPITREMIIQTTGNAYLTILTLPSCMDLLAAGALVAVVKDQRVLWAMAGLGAMIVAYCFVIIPWSDFALTPLWAPRAHIIYTGLALLFAPMITVAHRFRALRWEPLVWTGKISYGLYIWHTMAFLTVARLPLPEWASHLAGVALAFVVAALSWKYFEAPLLKLKDAPIFRPR